jgi:Rho termination factor, N-terminal domain
MGTRITVTQLEQMKTHELADLLANVVLLLRRMPNVECQQLIAQLPADQLETEELPVVSKVQSAQPLTLTAGELKNMKLPELKKLAKERHLPFSSRIKKDELINKLLAMGRSSEQFAIQDI